MSTSENQKETDDLGPFPKSKIYEDPNLKVLAKMHIEAPGYMQSPFTLGTMAEKYRGLKWELLNLEKASNESKTLLVMSSLAGEGKSSVVYNLAVSISLEYEWNSIIVDTSDSANSLTHQTGLSREKGLTDYLLGEASIHEVLYRSNVPGCSIVPMGANSSQRSELLSSSKMSHFIEELKVVVGKSYILLDSKEASKFADCKILIPVVDRVLLVVKTDTTPQVHLEDWVKSLPSEKIVGSVLTQDGWA